jgi:hypothetical protein
VFDDIQFRPPAVIDGDGTEDPPQIPVCGDGNKLYSVRDPDGDVTLSARQSWTKQNKYSPADCNEINCKAKIMGPGVDKITWLQGTKTCEATNDCSQLLPKNDGTCQLKHNKQSCCFAGGRFTGQICPDGMICDNGECGTGYKCVQTGSDISTRQCVLDPTLPSSGTPQYATLDLCKAGCKKMYECGHNDAKECCGECPITQNDDGTVTAINCSHEGQAEGRCSKDCDPSAAGTCQSNEDCCGGQKCTGATGGDPGRMYCE